MHTLESEFTITGTAALDHSHSLPTLIITYNHCNLLQQWIKSAI